MIVQKPGMHKSVSHNLTLVKCLLEAGIANSKDEVFFRHCLGFSHSLIKLKFLKFTTVTQGQMNKTAENTKYYLAVKLYNLNVLYAA